MPLIVTFEDKELSELRVTLDRAMNCWEPMAMPSWLQELSDKVDDHLGGSVKPRSRNVTPDPLGNHIFGEMSRWLETK